MFSTTSQNLDLPQLYLDLMKRALTDSIFLDHPLANYVPHQIRPGTSWLKRNALKMLSAQLQRYRIKLVEATDSYTPEARAAARERGLDWPARAHTMVGLKRLDNIQFCVESVIRNEIPGDLIETGVWRGGACIFMRATLKAYGDPVRNVWLADSFTGLPPPSPDKFSADAGDVHHTFTALQVSREDVEENFRRYGLLDDRVRFLQGWFKDTLPTAPISRLAVLRLDGDMYESTIQALDALYDKLSPGGFVIVDDYFLSPCAQAIHDFRKLRGIVDPIVDIDGAGSFWQRSA